MPPLPPDVPDFNAVGAEDVPSYDAVPESKAKPAPQEKGILQRAKDYVKLRTEAELQLALGLPLTNEQRQLFSGPGGMWEKVRSYGPAPTDPVSVLAGRGYQGINWVAGSSDINAKLENNPQVKQAREELKRRAIREFGETAGPTIASGLELSAQMVPGVLGGMASLGAMAPAMVPAGASTFARVAGPAAVGALENMYLGAGAEALGAEPGQELNRVRDYAASGTMGLMGGLGLGLGVIPGAVSAYREARKPPAPLPAWMQEELNRPPRQIGHPIQLEATREMMPPTAVAATRPALTQPEITAPMTRGPMPVESVLPERTTDPFMQARDLQGRLEFSPVGRPVPDPFMMTDAERVQQTLRTADEMLAARRAALPPVEQPLITPQPVEPVVPEAIGPVPRGTRNDRAPIAPPEVEPAPSPLIAAARWLERRLYEGDFKKWSRNDPNWSAKVTPEMAARVKAEFPALSEAEVQGVVEQTLKPNWAKSFEQQRTVVSNPVVGGGDVPYTSWRVELGGRKPKGPVSILTPEGKEVPVKVVQLEKGADWIAVAPEGMAFQRREKPLAGATGPRRLYTLVRLPKDLGVNTTPLIVPTAEEKLAGALGPRLYEGNKNPLQPPRPPEAMVVPTAQEKLAAAMRAAKTQVGAGPPVGEVTQISQRQAAMQAKKVQQAVIASTNLDRAADFIVQHANDPEAMRLYRDASRVGPVPGQMGARGAREFGPTAGPVPEANQWRGKVQDALSEVRRDPRSGVKPGPVVDDPAPLPNMSRSPALISMEEARKLQASDAWWRRKLNWLKKQSRLPEQAMPEELAWAARSWRAASEMMNVNVEKSFPHLQKSINALPFDRRVLVKDVIGRIKEGENIPAAMLPPEVRGLFEERFAAIRKMRDDLLKAGYFTEAEAKKFAEMDSLGQTWLTRDYEIYFNRGHYRASAQKYLNAVNGLILDAQKQGKTLSRESAKAYVRDLMHAAREGYKAGASIRSNDAIEAVLKADAINRGILKKRHSVPPYLRDLLGEIHNPAFITAMSHGEMYRMHHQYALSKSITADEWKGKLWSDTPEPGMYNQPIGFAEKTPQENKQAFGELAGKYVTPEMYEAVMQNDGRALDSFAFEALSTMQTWFRTAKVLLSPMTFIRNNTSNWFYSAVTGLPPWDAPLYADMQRASLRAMGEYMKAPTMEAAKAQGSAKWLVWAMEEGAVRPGRGSDIGGGRVGEIVKSLNDDPPSNAIEFADHVWKQSRKLKVKLGEVYEMIDTKSRLASFIYNTERLVQKGMPLEQAKRGAAAIVTRFYATGADIGPGVRDLARLPVVGPFMSWSVDNMRVMKNILTSPLRGDFVTPFRALTYGGFIWGMGKMATTASGVTPEQERAAEAAMSPSWKSRNPLRAVLGFDVDPATGVPKYAISLDAFSPYAVFLEGDDTFNGVPNFTKAIARNTATQVFGGAIVPIAETAVGSLMGLEKPFSPEPYPGEEEEDAAKRMWDWAVPQVVKQSQDAIRRTNPNHLRQYEEPLSLGEAALRLPGMPGSVLGLTKIGPRSAEGAVRRKIAEVAKGEKGIKRGTRDQTVTQERLRRIGQSAWSRSQEALK